MEQHNILHTFVVLAYKESEYLEACVRSVLRQAYRSHVVVATSTPNEHIRRISEKYGLTLYENPNSGQGIGSDFDFARTCVSSALVTIAHQDDVYDYQYSAKIVEMYEKHPEAIILFSDYYEIRNQDKVNRNLNLKIKRLMLMPLRLRRLGKYKFIKRLVLSMGNSICCPAVTYVNSNIMQPEIFVRNMLCNVDWKAWEILSKKAGSFVYCENRLMGHRVHEDSTTSEIIKNNIRTKEDYMVLRCFWPSRIAKWIARLYSLSEKSNQ